MSKALNTSSFDPAVSDVSPMRFYLNTKEIWEAIEKDCQQATRSIVIEQYILNNDERGERLLHILTEAVKRGVKVRLLLDYVGSFSMKSSPALKAFSDTGGEVIFDRPLGWVQALFPNTWFPRNHCKITVIDEEIAYIGGACCAAYMQHWRDTQIRLRGALVEQIYQASIHHWMRLSGIIAPKDGVVRQDTLLMQYVLHDPATRQFPLRKIMLREIRAARQHIALVSPYFFPPRWLRRALQKARRRGVEVTLIMSEQTDVGLAYILTRALLGRWRRKGFTVLFYHPVMLHAKYAVIDERWATVGSNNFDHLSLRFNREANLVLENENVVSLVQQQLENDKQQSRPATEQDWHQLNFREKWMGKLLSWAYKLI